MIAVDTNVLIYAEDPGDPGDRHTRAASLLTRLALSGAIVPVQVLGEFISVCRKKNLASLDLALFKVATYSQVFDHPQTTVEDIAAAAQTAAHHGLQFFDALIVTVSARAGATALISEDMQDGLQVGDLKVLNPFNPGNASEITRRANAA